VENRPFQGKGFQQLEGLSPGSPGMKKHWFPLPERQGQQSLQDFFLFFRGVLTAKSSPTSQGNRSGKFFFDETGIGFEIDPIQTPGMKAHCGQDKVGKPVSQSEDFFIRFQVCPDRQRPGPRRPEPFSGLLEVWNLIQVSMGSMSFK
jgi:hypothetical protein